MDNKVFLLATDPKNSCRDVIHSRDTSLRVNVFCIPDEDFVPNQDEIQLYAYSGKKLYVFETTDVNADDALDMISAIQWYADYIGCPDMEILPEDPRTEDNIAV